MHHALGIGLLVYLISYAFGEATARTVVGAVLLAGLAFVAYIGYRIVSGTI